MKTTCEKVVSITFRKIRRSHYFLYNGVKNEEINQKTKNKQKREAGNKY